MKCFLILLITTMIFASCGKELSLENAQPPEPVKETSRKYQLKAFYSDIPIDFIEHDEETRSETDLWTYVHVYLKDDINEFYTDSTLVQIYQNEIKMPGNSAAVLQEYYLIGTDSEGAYMKFLGPDYEPLLYRLQEINDEYFIIYVKWRNGSTVYSRFERIR